MQHLFTCLYLFLMTDQSSTAECFKSPVIHNQRKRCQECHGYTRQTIRTLYSDAEPSCVVVMKTQVAIFRFETSHSNMPLFEWSVLLSSCFNWNVLSRAPNLNVQKFSLLHCIRKVYHGNWEMLLLVLLHVICYVVNFVEIHLRNSELECDVCFDSSSIRLMQIQPVAKRCITTAEKNKSQRRNKKWSESKSCGFGSNSINECPYNILIIKFLS